jgi:hypothetical protein
LATDGFRYRGLGSSWRAASQISYGAETPGPHWTTCEC